MNVIAIAPHISHYPDPIQLPKGAPVQINMTYSGGDKQDSWMFCEDKQTGREGWIHHSFLKISQPGCVLMRADYTALELDVKPGEMLLLFQVVGGWGWCMRQKDGVAGWVPQECIQEKASCTSSSTDVTMV